MSVRKKNDDYNHFSKQRLVNNLTKKFNTVRTRILDLGNSNLRAAQNEVDQYTLSWNRYVTNFYISEGE